MLEKENPRKHRKKDVDKASHGASEKQEKRVRDLARDVSLSASAVIDLLREMGYRVRSHQSVITLEMEEAVRERIAQTKKRVRETLVHRKKIWGKEEEEPKQPSKGRKPAPQTSSRAKPSPTQKKKRRPSPPDTEKVEKDHVLVIPGQITLQELAHMMGVEPVELVKKAFVDLGVPTTINQTLTEDLIQLLAESYGYTVQTQTVSHPASSTERIQDEEGEPRPPVVTVMGHVDHGKTTLLDTLRRTAVAAQEAGGITQHIGAYRVHVQDRWITFIDTPGHEAFTAMRARGAQVTDIVVLVVAANEGVKPQTVEAINHAKAGGVPLIVAINKMDLPDANPDRVRRELSQHGLIPEEWGGDTIMVEISAKTGQNLDTLLEAIMLKAEEMDLRARHDGPAEGTVLEARLDRGKGPVATVLIQRGTLHQRDVFVCGTTWGRVRAMYDEQGRRVKEAGPSTPVLIQGFQDLPHTGDRLEVVDYEHKAREIAQERQTLKREQVFRGERALRIKRMQEKIQSGEIKEIPFILKADALGSVEAIADALSRIEVRGVRPVLIHTGVGMVTEADVELADASHAHIIAFHTRPDSHARRLAEEKGIQIVSFRVIYELIQHVEKVIRSYVEPEFREVVLGKAEVRKVFKLKVGTIAGCFVLEGTARRDARVRVYREGTVIHTGTIASLKRFQEDVEEVSAGMECGIRLKNFSKVKEGDLLEFFYMEEIPV